MISGGQIGHRTGDAAGRRRHVRGRASGGFSYQRRDPEIQDFHAAVGRHYQIAALEIAMDHAALVRMRQRVGSDLVS